MIATAAGIESLMLNLTSVVNKSKDCDRQADDRRLKTED